MEKRNYTYLLRCGDASLYGGWTNDPLKRIKAHNSGEGGKYTRAKLPVYITYLEELETKEEAMSREWHIKRLSREQKETLIEASGTVQLRPHHLLCIQLFEGKGYSPEFTENMTTTIRRLEKNPDIILTCCSDTLCSCCPNRCGNICDTEEKIETYDRAVLETCDFCEGQILKWEDAKKLAYDRILAAGKLRETCKNCQWGEICYNKADVM